MKAPGFDGEDNGDEIERDCAGETPAAARLAPPLPDGSSWFAVFTGRCMNSNVEGVLLPGWLCVSLSSARLAQRGGVSAATQQEALCVCVHVCAGFEASTEKALYLRYNVPTIPPSVSRSLFFFE